MSLLSPASRGTHLEWNLRNIIRRSAQDCAVGKSSIVHREICGDQVLGQPAPAFHHRTNRRAFELRHQRMDALHVDRTPGRSLKRIGSKVLGETEKSCHHWWVEVLHLGQDLLPDVEVECRGLTGSNRPTEMQELSFQSGLCQMHLSKRSRTALSASIHLRQNANTQCNHHGQHRSDSSPSVPVHHASFAEPPALAHAIKHRHIVPLSLLEPILP